MKRAAALRAEEEMHPDLVLSNNERQGYGHKPLYLQTLSLNNQPELASNISINTSATVNPDRDVLGTGSYHIQVNPANLGLAGVHSPTGAFLGDISMDRLRVLQLAHKQVVHEAPSDLAGSIAALLSRYKNSLPSENTARTNMRNHWATPPVLMGKLIKALRLTVERFASPLNFCSEMRQYFSATRPLEQVWTPTALIGWGLHRLNQSTSMQKWQSCALGHHERSNYTGSFTDHFHPPRLDPLSQLPVHARSQSAPPDDHS